jgi:IS4 transposase
MEGKLNLLGLNKAPAKSTVCDGMRERSPDFFEALYFRLVEKYQSFLSDSRTYGLTYKEILLIDSTTISLFSDILKGVGRNRKDDGKKKGGLKVHMLIDAIQEVGRYIKITGARVHDRNFLKDLTPVASSMIVFDRAYNDYTLFAEWTKRQAYFVTRLKKNAVYETVETLRKNNRKRGVAMVIKDEIIEMEYTQQDCGLVGTLRLRKVCYQDEKNRYYEFLTNQLDATAEEIAMLYKKRWGIELLFKRIKQNFQLHFFYGESENAIKTQVWCTLIAQLLLTVIQRMARAKKAFSTVATLIMTFLLGMTDMYELLRKITREYRKALKAPPNQIQLLLQC